MRLFLLGLCILLGATASARADETAPACSYEWDAAKYFPAEAANFGAGSAVRVCTRDGVKKANLFATPIARGQAGVCYFWVSFEDGAPPQTEHVKRYLRMQLANGACPRQDDAGYLDNDDVPDGVFAELTRRWNAGRFAFPPMSAEDRGSGMADFAALTKTVDGRKRFKLTAMSTDAAQPDMTISPDVQAATIDMIVGDSEHPCKRYFLAVDWMDGDFKILKVTQYGSGC